MLYFFYIFLNVARMVNFHAAAVLKWVSFLPVMNVGLWLWYGGWSGYVWGAEMGGFGGGLAAESEYW